MAPGKSGDTPVRFWLFVVGFICLACVVTAGFWFIVGGLPLKFYSGDLEKAGQFGDTYGYVNSLLSGLALAGAMVAILLQSLELRHQRMELQESQEAWHASAKAQQDAHQALADQAESMKQQATSMQQQAESLLLAAYLNALNTISQSSPENSNEQLEAVEMTRLITRQLKTKIEAFLGKAAPIRSREKWACEKLERLTKRLSRVLEAHSSRSNQSTNAIQDGVRKAQQEFEEVQMELSDEFDGMIAAIQGQFSDVLSLNTSMGGPEPEVASRWSKITFKSRGLVQQLEQLTRAVKDI